MTEMLTKTWEFLVNNGPQILTNIIVFLAILIIGRFIIMIIDRVLKKVLTKTGKLREIIVKFIISIVDKILWVVLLMIALPRIGIDVAPLIAGLGVGGFIVGFAFQESLSNFAAGFMLLVNEPFKKGDYVEAGGNAGTITDMTIMSTTMLTPDNKKIIVPNKGVWGGSIVNYSTMDKRRVDMSVGIAYSADIGKAIEIIRNLFKEDKRIITDPQPTVEVVELGDSSVNLVVRPWVKTSDYWDVYFHYMRGIKEAFDKGGIEIPFPQMDVHLDKE